MLLLSNRDGYKKNRKNKNFVTQKKFVAITQVLQILFLFCFHFISLDRLKTLGSHVPKCQSMECPNVKCPNLECPIFKCSNFKNVFVYPGMLKCPKVKYSK